MPVPAQTRQVAQAAFPRGNRYLQLRDTLGTLYEGFSLQRGEKLR